MNGNDRFLNINDAHLRVMGGNVHASSFNLDQISITTTSTTASTIDFLNETTAFRARSNIEVGTANLFVNTETSNVGIRTSSPEYALDVHGPANVSVLTASSNVGVGTFSPEYALDVHGPANVSVLTASSNVGVGTFSPEYALDVHGSANVGALTATTFSGSGAGLTALDAANITTGTLNAARVPTLNQSTTGSAATLTTPISIGGVDFDGSAAITPTTFTTATFSGDVAVSGSITGRGRFVPKTRTITHGNSLYGEVDTYTLESDENRIVLNNAQGTAASSRTYTANFNSGVPTEVGTIIYLEINSSRTATSAAGVNHKSEIQFNGTKVLSTGSNYIDPSGSYSKTLKRVIILTSNGWEDITEIKYGDNGKVGVGASPGQLLTLGGQVNPILRLQTTKSGDAWGTSSSNQYGKLQWWGYDYEMNQGSGAEMAGITVGTTSQYPGAMQMRFFVGYPTFSGGNWNSMYVGHLGTTDVTNIDFTGQHRNFIDGIPATEYTDYEGLIVSANKNKYYDIDKNVTTGVNAIQISQSLPLVSLSTKEKDKACFGVISGSEDPDTREYSQGSYVSVCEKQDGDRRAFINSVGEGAIWVTNINGPLESGDYITTSNVAGYGQKQDSEFLANYTVAKITMDCDFDPVTQPVQVIKKDEDGENVLDEHGQIQWEDHPTETEPAYKIRYLDANGNITDEANAVHKAAFVGCTYHCG